MPDILKAGEQGMAMLEKVAVSGDRRSFLKIAAATVALFSVAGCSDDDNSTNPPNGEVNLGSGDVGVLNYAYALEQLEAAFYIQVATSFYSGATSQERDILTDIRNHEIAHRDFFKAAIPANGGVAIHDLSVDFGTNVDFKNRDSVLGTAKVFEDLGVAAYNGAGKLLVNPTFLLLAGKIVSVEARHAAVIRDLLMPGTASFAGDDVVDPITGLDRAMDPAAVLMEADPFIVTKINASNLPTS